MTTSRTPQHRRRAIARAAGVLLVPVLLTFGVSPVAAADEPAPAVTSEATPEPSGSPPEPAPAEPSPGPSGEPDPEPSAEPAEASATPSPESALPTAAAEPTATPDPAATATPAPSPAYAAPAAPHPTTAPRLVTKAAAPAEARLGTAGNFAILAGSTVTNSGRSVVTGDVGLHPGSAVTGFESCTGPANCVALTGTMHVTNGVAQQAKADLRTAYDTLVGLEETCTPLVVELGGTTLTPGVYCSPTFGLTGTLTLSGIGEFVFLTGAGGSSLTTATDSEVLLVDGADACGVYWQVASSAVIGEASAFAGNILADTAISFGAGATLDGSALALDAAVTLIGNTITDSRCAGDDAGTPGSGTPSPSTVPVSRDTGPLPAVGVDENAGSPGPATGGGPDSGRRDPGLSRAEGSLPATGSPIGLLLLLAALALGLGALLVLFAPRPGRHRITTA